MRYCEINDVKKVLKLPLKDNSNDSELNRCLGDSFSLIDVLLNAQGLTVPTVVPQIIANCAKYFAAWEFQCKRRPFKADLLWQEADRLLCSYVDQFCSIGVSF